MLKLKFRDNAFNKDQKVTIYSNDKLISNNVNISFK